MFKGLLGNDQKVRILAKNIRTDLGRLQVAMLKKNEHDISLHLGNAIERSDELEKITGDAGLSIAQ